MNSFIGWVGGKRALRDIIISEFPEQAPKRYIEVFGGAGWVLFHKEKVSKQLEVYNDIDSNLVNLYRVIKYHRTEFEREFELTLACRENFNDYKEQINVSGLTDIQRAVRYFYLIKLSFGSAKDSYATSGKSLKGTINRLEEVQERLQGVAIENKDFQNLIKVYDKEDALFYLDPPYHKTEKYYKNGNEFTVEDHIRLCECLKKIKGKFILSYNDNEFIRKLYKDFIIKDTTRKNTLSAGSNTKEFKELIIKNFE